MSDLKNSGLRSFADLAMTVGLGALNPALALAWVVWAKGVAARLRGLVERDFTVDSIWLPVIAAGCVIASFIMAHPAPSDDLLKDLVSGRYGFDYRKAFWASPLLTHGDQYIGFDLLASWVYAHLPLRWAYAPFQAALVLGYLAVQARLYPRILRDVPYRHGWTALLILLVWLQPEFIERVVSGRPESFMALWAFSALAMDTPLLVVIWAILGAFLMPSYWLAGVYIPAALLLPGRGLKSRLLIGAGVAAIFMGFWGWYTDLRWPIWLLELHTEMGLRQEAVAENMGMALAMYAPAMLVAIVAFWRFRDGLRTVSPWIWAVIAWFLLPDMIRYLDIIAALVSAALATAIAADREHAQLDGNWPGLFAVLAGLFWVVGQVPHTELNAVHIAGYRPGQRVLTAFGPLTYDAIYENPGIRVAPAMELGATEISVQRASMALQRGRVSCSVLARYHVAYVIENSLRGTPPACLGLLSMDGATRVWRVRGEADE
ncbi:hypothetical protein HF282_12875 [Acidithiobacillus ferrooxidans]|nr:hypothetical protein [Acidithiobacillus ferrooxidans]